MLQDKNIILESTKNDIPFSDGSGPIEMEKELTNEIVVGSALIKDNDFIYTS